MRARGDQSHTVGCTHATTTRRVVYDGVVVGRVENIATVVLSVYNSFFTAVYRYPPAPGDNPFAPLQPAGRLSPNAANNCTVLPDIIDKKGKTSTDGVVFRVL